MTFEEYLLNKKIDSISFKRAEDERWKLFESEFNQMHPKSFTAQKLFLINAIRRAYPYTQKEPVVTEVEEKKPVTSEARVKPKMTVKRPAIGGKQSTKPKMSKPVIKRPKKED